MDIPSFRLSDGAIPGLGLGTWQLTGQTCVAAVQRALALGYTQIDTAIFYGNHAEIAEAIRDVDRAKLFLTSKVPPGRLRHDDVIAACEETLRELGTNYLDLWLIHWPNKGIPMEETFRALKELKDAGKVKAVGVSNFTVRHLKEALQVSKVPIAVNQVEFHPGLYQKKLLEFCEEHGIIVTAYSPLGRGGLVGDETLAAIGKAHGKTAGQVALRWLHQHGIVVIPKASSEAHLRENRGIFDFSLTDEEMARIDALDGGRIVRPPFAEFDD